MGIVVRRAKPGLERNKFNDLFTAAGYSNQDVKAAAAVAGCHIYTFVMVSARVCSSFARFVGIIAGVCEVVVCSRDRPGYGVFEKQD